MKTFTFIILFLFAAALYSQTHTWTGNGGDTNWNNADNWDALTVPDETSDILISGIVNVDVNAANDGGTIVIQNGATLSINNTLNIFNTISANDATIIVLGTLNNDGGAIVVESGATLSIDGTLTTGLELEIGNAGILEMTSGTLNGTGTIENHGTFLFEGMNQKQLDQITINNFNNFLVNNSGTINLSNGVVINNLEGAMIDINSTGGITQDVAHDATVNNFGTITTYNNGVSTSFYMIFDMYNHGLVNVQENQTFLFLTIGADLNNLEDGTLIGFGSYDITANFSNLGTINPGGAGTVGTLDVVNNFDFPSGATLSVDVENASTYDSLRVIGFPELAGTFDVHLQSELNIGDELTVIIANDITACNLPAQVSANFGANDVYVFDVICDQNTVILKVQSVLLGNSEFISNSDILQMYPNPVNQELTVAINSSIVSHLQEPVLKIYSLLGQEVATYYLDSESQNIDVSSLAQGMYLVRFCDGTQPITTTKFLKH